MKHHDTLPQSFVDMQRKSVVPCRVFQVEGQTGTVLLSGYMQF